MTSSPRFKIDAYLRPDLLIGAPEEVTINRALALAAAQYVHAVSGIVPPEYADESELDRETAACYPAWPMAFVLMGIDQRTDMSDWAIPVRITPVIRQAERIVRKAARRARTHRGRR